MKADVTFSRRKMCSNVRRTVVVPAPDEPVTEMIGCCTDMGSAPEQAAVAEQRRALADGIGIPVIAIDAVHFLAGAEDQRHALMDRLGGDVKDASEPRGGGAVGLLDEPRDR